MEPRDISVDLIATPDGVIETRTPYPRPDRIAWSASDLEEMPVLAELAPWERRSVPDLPAPEPDLVFAGLNPGRASATAGRHFAGPGNHFWRLLHAAGLTPRQLAPAEDETLLTPKRGGGLRTRRPGHLGSSFQPAYCWRYRTSMSRRNRVTPTRPATMSNAPKMIAPWPSQPNVRWMGIQPRMNGTASTPRHSIVTR